MSKPRLETISSPVTFYVIGFDSYGERRTVCLDRAAARQLVDELDRWLCGPGEERPENPFCAACTGYAYHYPDCPQHPANAKPDSLPVAEVRQVLETIARWTEAALAERDQLKADLDNLQMMDQVKKEKPAICGKCGGPVDGSDHFCAECGNRLREEKR